MIALAWTIAVPGTGDESSVAFKGERGSMDAAGASSTGKAADGEGVAHENAAP